MLASISLAAFGMDDLSSDATGSKGEISPQKIVFVRIIGCLDKKLTSLQQAAVTTSGYGSLQTIRKDFFTTIEDVTIVDPATTKKVKIKEAWLTLKNINNTAKVAATNHISETLSYLSEPIRKQTLKATASSVFNPTECSSVFVPNPTMLAFLKVCAKQGYQGYKVYGCDNFNFEFFGALTKRLKDFFEFFTCTYISGEEGHLMESDAFFPALQKKFRLASLEGIHFIDTKPEFFAVVEKHKLKPILFNPSLGPTVGISKHVTIAPCIVSLKKLLGLSAPDTDDGSSSTKVTRKFSDDDAGTD